MKNLVKLNGKFSCSIAINILEVKLFIVPLNLIFKEGIIFRKEVNHITAIAKNTMN